MISLSSFLFTLLAALILSVLGMLYVRSTHQSTRLMREKRRAIIIRAEQLRLPKMMQALGIGLGRYFYKADFHDIEKNITDCETCSSTKRCDEKLKIPELNPVDIGFCPCRERLAPFSRETRIKN